MNTLVLYYSRTGNNRLVAQRIAERLACDIDEIRPALGSFFFLLLGSAMKAGLGNRKLARDPGDYDRVILCGPIWMGTVVLPLRSFLLKYRKRIKSLAFVTACGSDETSKSGGFGYETVFGKFRDILGPAFAKGYALPVTLAAPAGAVSTKIVLDETNFTGEIASRYEAVVEELGRA